MMTKTNAIGLFLFTTLCLTVFGQESDFRVKVNGTETSRTISIIGYAGTARNITIPARINSVPVSVIGEGAFQSMSGIISVSLPLGVTTIESGAFSGCSALTSLFIPASVTSIGDGAFSGCFSLVTIEVDPRNQQYRELGGVLFDKTGTRLLYYPSGKIGYYTVPDGVSVAPGAFTDADKLSPESYEEIAGLFGSAVFSADAGQSDALMGRNQGPAFSGRSTAVCYVSAQGSDANDGLSEATSFRTLAKAIKTAASGDIRTITVIGRVEGGLTLSNVSEKLLISGKPNATDTEKAAIFVNNGFVLQVNGATKLRLEHIEISGGKRGGILIANGASLTLGTGARVSGNSGERGGGVNIRGQNTSLIMEGNATISGNSASANGGGVFIGERGVLIMQNAATISGNSGQGGGVFIEDASFIMQGSAAVSGNSAPVNGGGVFALRGNVTLRDNSAIRDNSSGGVAGGAYLDQSTLIMEDNSAISGNSASTTGGGVELASVKDGKGSSVVLQNYAAITDNQAIRGGGLFIGIGESNSVALRDSAAISGNWARETGGGVFMYNLVSLKQESSAGIFDNIALESPNISPLTAAAGPVLKRKVVSYKLFGEEHADKIDRVELQWSTEATNWFSKNHPLYNEVQSNLSDYHTLKMTIYGKNGEVGSFTFRGGNGTLGNNMAWNRYDGSPELSGPGSWDAEGDLFWNRRNGDLVVPNWIEVNCETEEGIGIVGDNSFDYLYFFTSYSGTSSLTFSTPVRWRTPDDGYRLRSGYNREYKSEAIIIELDGSLFPNPLVSTLGPYTTYRPSSVTVRNANTDISSDEIPASFTNYYASNGKKAGEYTYDGSRWSYEGQ